MSGWLPFLRSVALAIFIAATVRHDSEQHFWARQLFSAFDLAFFAVSWWAMGRLGRAIDEEGA